MFETAPQFVLAIWFLFSDGSTATVALPRIFAGQDARLQCHESVNVTLMYEQSMRARKGLTIRRALWDCLPSPGRRA